MFKGAEGAGRLYIFFYTDYHIFRLLVTSRFV
jgi:hypothetical protein